MVKDILIHPSMQDVVKNYTKKITIRKGSRDYLPNDRIFVGCDSYAWFPVMVTSVTYTNLEFVAQDVLEADGFTSWDDMFNTMKKFYPDITPTDRVTVIRWEYV
jgi:hypothetical protein